MTDDIFTLFPTPASPKLFLSTSSSFFSGVNLGYIYDVRVSLYINGKSTLIISFVSPAAISETQWRRIARKKRRRDMDQKEEMRDIRLFIENLNKVVRFLCKKKSLPNAGQQPIRV